MSPRLIHFPKIEDARGNLTFIESEEHVPFKVERVFWTYDVPGGQIRGGHAYSSNEEVIIALSGSFDVVIEMDGDRKVYSLNRSYYGLYVPALTWRHLENFSTNAVAFTMASEPYSKKDYVRDFNLLKKS